MAPPRKKATVRKENAKQASIFKQAKNVEIQHEAEKEVLLPRLKNEVFYLKKEVEELKENLKSSNKNLLDAQLEIKRLKSENDILIATRKYENDQFSSSLLEKQKEGIDLKCRADQLQKRVDALVEESPSRGKCLKEYSMIKATSTKKDRYERIIKMISSFVGHLNVDAFLYDFLKMADEDEELNFTMKLSPWNCFFIAVKHQLSDGFLKDFKQFTKEHLHIDIFASRQKIEEVKKKFATSKYYTFERQTVMKPSRSGKQVMAETALVKANDVHELLSRRLEVLSRHGRLLFDDGTKDNIVIGVGGDKGSDTTKLVIVLENVDSPNDPHAVLLLGLYTGNDSHSLLKQNFASVFDQLNQLHSVRYFDGSNNVEKAVVMKPLGDCKFVSAMYGHAGQNSKSPCYVCNLAWSTHGSDTASLKNFDFELSGEIRTLSDLKKTGVPLLDVDPLNAGPPGVHTILGICQYYCIDWLIAMAINFDTGSSSPANLKQLKKDLKKLVLETEETTNLVDSLESSLERINDAVTTIQKNCKTTKPKQKNSSHCTSSFCIVGSSKKSSFRDSSIFQCTSCKAAIHDVCAFYITEEQRLVMDQTNAVCLDCRHGMIPSIPDRLSLALEIQKSVNEQLLQAQDILEVADNERLKLEQHLKGSRIQSEVSTRQLLEAALRSIGCDSRIWYQDLTGNQARKFLRHSSIDKVLAVFTSNSRRAPNASEKQKIDLMRSVMLDLATLMSAASNSVKNDDEIEEIERVLERFVGNLREAQPDASVTPKLHLLSSHLIPYLKRYRSWGRVTEQGIESLHAIFNRLNVRFAAVRDPIQKATLIVDRLSHFNLIFDIGSSWFKEE
ncbi:hypothetical protein GCK72_007408 [Caenorhabditis remanei]|uniref:Zinc finger PHD-type domain-containing protein n=1 Tax=Caenorhabditis remanei TaxID=31234 RepID=A0A6A5HJ25_CAERE|nr:hypothetical protein GCK72_007408 [Caenorhabditis remanei]KAF1767449.1 hypothetical protein GCK72_007408 [Caenorhabditis remanei]